MKTLEIQEKKNNEEILIAVYLQNYSYLSCYKSQTY